MLGHIQRLTCLSIAIAVCIASVTARAEKPVDYGIDIKANRKAFLAMSEERKVKIVQDFGLMLNKSNTMLDRNHFQGVRTWQNPFDVWVTQEIIFEVKPDVIVEAGTFRGGSALMWAMYLQQVTPGGRVITIDIQDKRVPLAKNHRLSKHVDFLLGGSTDPAIVAEVKRRTAGKRVMFILDSLHTKEHVAGELAAYADLVPVGGYIVVQDTPVGAIHAIHEFVENNDDWVVDKGRERLLFTVNVDGFLKRVR